MKYEKPLAKDIKGIMYLIKNERYIKEHRFGQRWERKKKMQEWAELVKTLEPSNYFIKIILD